VKFGRMKPHRRNQLFLVLFLVASAGAAVGLALIALKENINLFYSPEEIVSGKAPHDQLIRAGGMVREGSVVRSTTDLQVSFVVSDLQQSDYTVQYEGILPDLFREGQGVIARGRLGEDGVFQAEEVLAKHDENYMPPEVADVIEKAHAEAKK
jgi:cytochrome c-type biogenesis protein CcmE